MPRLEWNIETLKASGRDIIKGVPNDVTNPRALWLRLRSSEGEARVHPRAMHGLFAEVIRGLAGDDAVRVYWADELRQLRKTLIAGGYVPAEHAHGESITVSADHVYELLEATTGLAGGRAVAFIGESEPGSRVPTEPRGGWRRLSYLVVLELFDDAMLVEPLTSQTEDLVLAIEKQMRILAMEFRGVR